MKFIIIACLLTSLNVIGMHLDLSHVEPNDQHIINDILTDAALLFNITPLPCDATISDKLKKLQQNLVQQIDPDHTSVIPFPNLRQIVSSNPLFDANKHLVSYWTSDAHGSNASSQLFERKITIGNKTYPLHHWMVYLPPTQYTDEYTDEERAFRQRYVEANIIIKEYTQKMIREYHQQLSKLDNTIQDYLAQFGPLINKTVSLYNSCARVFTAAEKLQSVYSDHLTTIRSESQQTSRALMNAANQLDQYMGDNALGNSLTIFDNLPYKIENPTVEYSATYELLKLYCNAFTLVQQFDHHELHEKKRTLLEKYIPSAHEESDFCYRIACTLNPSCIPGAISYLQKKIASDAYKPSVYQQHLEHVLQLQKMIKSSTQLKNMTL